MIFPSEKKKELLRYASRNNPATCKSDGIPISTQQPPPPHHPHQRLPQTFSGNCCICCCPNNSSSAMRQFQHTPPPPYSMISCSIEYSGSMTQPATATPSMPPAQDRDLQQLAYCHDASAAAAAGRETDLSVSASATEEELDCSYMKGGCSYESSGADLLSDENGTCYTQLSPAPTHRFHPTPTTAMTMTTAATTFKTTAAKMFRNCCGGGHSTDSSSSSGYMTRTTPADSRRQQLHRQRTTSTPMPMPMSTPTCPIHPATPTANAALPQGGAAIRNRTVNQNLNALLKPFKNKQVAELLQAVKSRVDPPAKFNSMLTTVGNNAIISSTPSYLQCILIKNTTPLDEEQHVTTCQLFFWWDLRDGSELRRLPLCPSAKDFVYTCCNPLHWFRIIHPIDTDTAPPPYQRSKMLRLRDTDSEGNTQNIERSTGVVPWSACNANNSHHHHHNPSHNHSSQSISSIIKQQAESQLYVPTLLESFTTEGKDRGACSKIWCQIAYWELAQRVGELFQAKKSSVNIYGEGPADSNGDSMCLRDLGGKRPPTDAVQNTRQKVGLGVTLSLESDDVWIYNRSNVPIFVDSPTLSERLDRVCKVMPGYCLKAFETHRAQWLAGKQSQRHDQMGPIDRFSMKISFAKGWGNTYRRQDVMGCPCWLEVHFTHLR